MITSPGDVGAQRRIVGTRGSHCAPPISPLAPRSPPNRGACRARLTQYRTGMVPSSRWQRRHPARPLHARATPSRTTLSNCARLGRSAAAPAGFWAPTTAAQPEAVRDLTPAYRCASSGADVHTTKALVRYSPPGKSNAPFGPPDSPLQNSRGSASPTRRTNACGMGGEPQSVLAIPGRVPGALWRARSTVINALTLRLPFWLPASVRADWIITRSESPIQKWYVTQPCRKPLPPSYMSCPYTVDAALREKPDARPRDAGMHDSGPLRRTQVIDICHIGARCEALSLKGTTRQASCSVVGTKPQG